MLKDCIYAVLFNSAKDSWHLPKPVIETHAQMYMVCTPMCRSLIYCTYSIRTLECISTLNNWGFCSPTGIVLVRDLYIASMDRIYGHVHVYIHVSSIVLRQNSKTLWYITPWDSVSYNCTRWDLGRHLHGSKFIQDGQCKAKVVINHSFPLKWLCLQSGVRGKW